ncbi:uncharacterized protein LOC126801025 isoform X2 [Argentina anserina]|nr:uncharacterized protein LOC126801025 isoform X2 [Potentilla anserina]
MAKEFSHLEFRCDLLKFGRLMTHELRADITVNKLQLMGTTPFSSLFGAFFEGKIIESACRKSDMDIVAILKCFDKKEHTFQFGDIKAMISANDIAELFGLNVEGREINLNQKKRKGDAGFINRLFPDQKRLSKVILEKKIRDVAKLRGAEDEHDFVRLICLYFCVTLFFCNSGNDLSWFIVPYIEDLESMSSYAWARAVKNYLDNSLISMYGRPESACGCLIALLFWFCERTGFIEPIKGRDELQPKFLKWNLLELYGRMKVVDMRQLKEIVRQQPLSVGETPRSEKSEFAITCTEEVESKEHDDTNEMSRLLPTHRYSYAGGAGQTDTKMDATKMEKRIEELVGLLEAEQAKNKSLRCENEILQAEVHRLHPGKVVVDNESQTRNLRSRAKCKEPSFQVDYITSKSKKGKEKVDFVKKDDGHIAENSPSKKTSIPSVDGNIGVRRLRVGKHMTVHDAQKLKDYLAKGESGLPLWRGEKALVGYKDAKAILNEDVVSVQAMDSYLEILSKQQLEEGDPLPLFMPTFDWEDMNGGDKTRGVEAYCEPFFDNVVTKDMIFIPIIHRKPEQFTLLVLNKEFERWEHYNTQKPHQTTSMDQCFEDATKLHVEISKHLVFLKNNGESILEKKMIWKHVKRGREMKHYMYKVSAKDCALLTWLGSNNLEQYRIVSMKYHPKHEPPSVDSGIAVIYIIKKLLEGAELETTFSKGFMAELRAHVLGMILNDRK